MADRGTAGLLALIGALAAFGLAAVSGLLVAGTVAHTRADAAADLVAVGTAGQLLSDPAPCDTAAALAAANGVTLADCRVTGLTVGVAVAAPPPPGLALMGKAVHATARAELQVAEGP